MSHYDVIIIGAGAAGLMCAIEAGKRGRRVLVIDHAAKPAEKIRISGGGRCNFTNLHASPAQFISQNPRFCVSALSRYTQQDFIALVNKHGIAYHEKTLGQLFCDGSSRQIIDMLLLECQQALVEIRLSTAASAITKTADGFSIQCKSLGEGDGEAASLTCQSLVIASGGKSIPKMGATGFGYEVAKQFALPVITPRAGLVPLTFSGELLDYAKSNAGVAQEAIATFGKAAFREAALFTHRGMSGPAILQISSYWQEGAELCVNIAPDHDAYALLLSRKDSNPKQDPVTVLSEILSKKLAQRLCDMHGAAGRLAEHSNKRLRALADGVNNWRIIPSGTEGYRTAEVTLGGVDTTALSSKTCEVRTVPGLFFIGEVVDVTGHLGGYNFQWAWASGYAAGQAA